MILYSAVVVWQLRGLVEDVHCFFLRCTGGFVLHVERAGELLLREDFNSLSALMDRALELRRNLVGLGLRAAEPAGIPDSSSPLEALLQRFVKNGTAALYEGPSA